jgi:hypothetical protein
MLIRASELGEYRFCARAWWRVAGLEPAYQERRDAGAEAHARHGRRARASSTLLVVGIALVLIAVAFVVLG